MKAIINGTTVEGTPEEVWSFLQRSNSHGTQLKPYTPMPDWMKQETTDAAWKLLNPKSTCADTRSQVEIWRNQLCPV